MKATGYSKYIAIIRLEQCAIQTAIVGNSRRTLDAATAAAEEMQDGVAEICVSLLRITRLRSMFLPSTLNPTGDFLYSGMHPADP